MDKIKASQFADLAYYSRFVPTSRTVTFAAPSSTLTNFPALVKCNSTFHIGTQTGYDVHFQDLSGNELYYDLDYYDSVTGNGAWWVQIPSLSSSGTTSIKMLYGDSSVSTNGSTPLTVWADYAAVYHLNELNSTSQLNSATGTRSSAGLASPSFVTANQGTGRVLRFTYSGSGEDITQGICTQNVTFPQSPASYSVSMLMIPRLSSASSTEGGSGKIYMYVFSMEKDGGLIEGFDGMTATFGSSYQEIIIGHSPFIAKVTVNATTAEKMYLVGASLSYGVWRYAQVDTSFNSGNIGQYANWANYPTYYSLVSAWRGTFDYDTDELRLCKVAHTQDWMTYEYSNYIDHSNNVTYGPEA